MSEYTLLLPTKADTFLSCTRHRGSQSLIDPPEHRQLYARSSTHLLSLRTCMQTTHTSPDAHAQSVLVNIMRLYWQKWYCRLARMDSESIWNWSAYFALIKASALISDWQFKHRWYTGNTSVFFPSPLLIINKLGGVVFFLPTSIAFFVNLTANMEKGEMPGV